MQNADMIKRKLKKLDELVGKDVLDFVYEIYDS